MKVKYGKGSTEFGPGVDIILTGEEVARAISSYIVARGIHIDGPRTISVNESLCHRGRIYVDPSGSIIVNGKRISGRGDKS